MDDRTRALVAEIEAAFADIPYPGDGAIVPNNAGPHPRNDGSEDDDARILLAGRDWRELASMSRMELGSVLAFLTPQAWRYFLPGFLLFVLTKYDKADVVIDEVISSLMPPQASDIDDNLASLARMQADLGVFDEQTFAQLTTMLTEQRDDPDRAARFTERVAEFDARQRHAIRGYLEYMQDRYPDDSSIPGPAEAIARYWGLA